MNDPREAVRLITELNRKTQEGRVDWSNIVSFSPRNAWGESERRVSSKSAAFNPSIFSNGPVYSTRLGNLDVFLFKADLSIFSGMFSNYPPPESSGYTLDIVKDGIVIERITDIAGLSDLYRTVEVSSDVIGKLMQVLDEK